MRTRPRYCQGSSPRVWGQDFIFYTMDSGTRIIPTRVGTSKNGSFLQYTNKDHPHACGDKKDEDKNMTQKTGSSPRVWGQDLCCRYKQVTVRIIPTRVGTRDPVMRYCQDCRDHPHACGDKRANGKIGLAIKDHPHACGDKCRDDCGSVQNIGSSPRVWGQVYNNYQNYHLSRIIPTRVGTRLKKSRKIAVLQNQPLRFPLTFHRSFV